MMVSSTLSTGKGTLIIGNNQAGIQIATSLREQGDQSPIVLVGEEEQAPYQRPPLSKGLLTREMSIADCAFRAPSWYHDRGIEVISGERITGIVRDPSGGVAVSETGQRFSFTRLALATGAVPRQLPLEGSDLKGVGYLRDAQDSIRLQDQLQHSQSVVVIGGGFIGLEIAAAARSAGKHVTILEASPRLVGRAVAQVTSEFYLEAHRRRGTRVILNAAVKRILGHDGRVSGVELENGQAIPADVVILGIGVIPRTELAEQLGLDVDNGVLVDQSCVTSDGLTVAAGDCANMLYSQPVSATEKRIRLESVPNAIEQGRIAANALLGIQDSYSVIPWFWSEQADIKLQIAGLSNDHDATVVRGNPSDEKFSVLYYRENCLIAADCINSPKDFVAVRHALKNGQNIDAEAAMDTNRPLRTLTQVRSAA